MRTSPEQKYKKAIRIKVKMQIKGTGRPVCKKTLMQVNNPTNKTIFTDLKFNTQDFKSTKNTRNQFAQESQKSKEDFHKSQPKKISPPQQLKSPSVKASSPATIKCDPRKNNLISTQTMAISNPLIKKKTKSFQITILPCEVSFVDLIKYTNIESRIRNDIILKYPNNSKPYLSRVGKYTQKYYYKNFIYKKKWPSNLKFKDDSVRTMEDLQCLKNQEKERKINWQPNIFVTSDEDRRTEIKVFEANKVKLPMATPTTPRSKRIIESIGDDSSVLINKPVTILPSQISYDDFRNFTNIESCVHEDILRKDPKHAELHFTRVESYIRKYYDNYFLPNAKWPSRIKFLDRTIGSFDDLERKKCRMRYGSTSKLAVPAQQQKDVKCQSTYPSLNRENTSDQSNEVNQSDNLSSFNNNNKENSKQRVPNTGKIPHSTIIEKINSNAGIKDIKHQTLNEGNITPSKKLPICSCTKSCIKLSKNMNSIFSCIPKYSKYSPSNNNCYKQVHSERCPNNDLTKDKKLGLESSESDVTPICSYTKSKKRKATSLNRHNAKKRCTNTSDSLKEETMCQSDVESSCNSEDSTETILFPLSRIQNPKTSLDANSTIINEDKADVDFQLVTKEPNDNVTNEELGVLRNLCIKLEAEEANQEDDLIVLQCEEKNTIEKNLVNSQLKKLAGLASNCQERQEIVANEVVLSAKYPPLDIKPEFNDNSSERNFSSYSSDVKIIENKISQSITINDTGDTVDELLEIMMNRSDTSENIGLSRRIIKPSCNARSYLKKTGDNSKTNDKENSNDLNINELFNELAHLLDDFDDHLNVNQDKCNHSSQPLQEDSVDTSCRMTNSSSELCDSMRSQSAPSTARSSLSTDYVSETTICSESSMIVPYQSQSSTNSSTKSEKANSKVSETSRAKNFRRTKSIRSKNLKKNTRKSKKSISNRRKSIVNTTYQPSLLRKRKFKSISTKLKKDLFATKRVNILRATTGTENMIEDDTLQLSDDYETDDESRVAIRLNRKIVCHNYQWISSLHWQQVPNTIMLTTYYKSSIPLLNVVGVLPLRPKISLWRHQLLRIKIFSDTVHFYLDIDASNEDDVYSLLEHSLPGASDCSSIDLVVLRFLQTIFDYFPPICLEKQNISIADTSPLAD